jgi:hypothetical protein
LLPKSVFRLAHARAAAEAAVNQFLRINLVENNVDEFIEENEVEAQADQHVEDVNEPVQVHTVADEPEAAQAANLANPVDLAGEDDVSSDGEEYQELDNTGDEIVAERAENEEPLAETAEAVPVLVQQEQQVVAEGFALCVQCDRPFKIRGMKTHMNSCNQHPETHKADCGCESCAAQD